MNNKTNLIEKLKESKVFLQRRLEIYRAEEQDNLRRIMSMPKVSDEYLEPFIKKGILLNLRISNTQNQLINIDWKIKQMEKAYKQIHPTMANVINNLIIGVN